VTYDARPVRVVGRPRPGVVPVPAPASAPAPATTPASVPSSEPLLRTLLGTVLRRVRRAEGRTLQDVATQARISIAYLSEVERGRKEPSSEVLVAVCRALGIRVVDLLAEATSELLTAQLTTAQLTTDLRSRHEMPWTARSLPDAAPRARLSVA